MRWHPQSGAVCYGKAADPWRFFRLRSQGLDRSAICMTRWSSRPSRKN